MQCLKRILVVEDDPSVQLLMKLSLESVGGFTVKLFSSGREALDEAKDFAPDMVLLDVMMPGMDGPSVFQALRLVPGLSQVPVVFVTAKALPHELAQLQSLGASAVISKPFDPMALPRQLHGVWEAHSRTH